MTAPPASAVLRHLEAATIDHPLERKLLVCRSMGEGREILRALALRRSWIGWEVTTPSRLALELVAGRLAAAGLAVADGFEEEMAVDSALDRALETAPVGLQQLGESTGFRQAVVNAVAALRLAGIDAPRLRDSPSSNPPVRGLLARVLERYGDVLDSAGRVDAADALREALAVFRDGAHSLDPRRTYLLPELSLRGSTGRFVGALLDAGAVAIRADPVDGLDPPGVLWNPATEPAPLSGLTTGEPVPAADVELFAASGPADEIREVLRRVLAAGLRWDEVEIIATDPVVYGSALHALSQRLDIPVSYAVGLPVERTRPGRATTAYFRWIQGGFKADIIRRLLEAGDLRSGGAVESARLAARFRALRIGWGHARYLPAIERALDRLEGPPRPRRHETEEEAAARVDRERSELEALRSILAPILAATPPLDAVRRGSRVSPAELAGGLRAFLDRVAPGDEPSSTARERLLGVAERVAATLTRPTEPAQAISHLQRHLEIRVPAPAREGSAPWISEGGHLHLSDVEHGGYAARPATFIVGLDADRFPGAGLQDPLLLDSQRRALDRDALPSSADRLAAARFRLAACVARLRGRVTLSYSAWDPAEARAVAPASVLLQAYRSITGQRGASFDALADALGDAASAIPDDTALDATDLWFGELHADGLLRDGAALVRRVYSGLDAGLAGRTALAEDEPTAHHGLVRPRAALDPRGGGTTLSASGLEDLGTCARRYFYKYVLGIRPPDDPELDPDAWLDALGRGGLLHAVYEASLREAREAGIALDDPRFEGLALEALEREARRIERDIPAPGSAVRARQMTELREDVRSFVAMVAARPPDWEAVELRFGFRGEPPASLPLKGGVLEIRGAIDRIDRAAGGLTVVDYKTGGSDRFERRHGTFHGGRRLQNAVYAAVAESILEARVRRMEYHFPTRKGQNEVIGFPRDELRRGLGLIDRLLDGVAAGRFLPTEEPRDCRFCDYAPVCRHRGDGFRAETPLADWAASRFHEVAEYRERREARKWEETFLAELEDHGETS